MRRKPLLLLLPTFAALTAATWYLGGWAVITVDDLPDYVSVGQRVPLSFVVRQHGMKPLDGLQPRIEAKSGSLELTVAATPVGASGHYVAPVNLPRAGEWTLTIYSGFGPSKATLVPLRAVDAHDGATPAITPRERGRRLFIAKGCFTCHVNSEATDQRGLAVGPELTGRRYPPDYLAKFLADPAAMRPTTPVGWQMPNLALKDREIASLVAFLNADRQLSER